MDFQRNQNFTVTNQCTLLDGSDTMMLVLRSWYFDAHHVITDCMWLAI